MKFRFCGDGDCPDWVLAEIISTLSNLSAPKLEMLTTLVSKKIVGDLLEEDNIKLITADIFDDGKSAVACLDFILVNAARYNIGGTILLEELQQLGLPKLHASAICRVLKETESLIRNKLTETTFKINELDSVSSKVLNNTFDAVVLELKISKQLIDGLPNSATHTISIDKANLSTLHEDMVKIRKIMQRYKENRCNVATWSEP